MCTQMMTKDEASRKIDETIQALKGWKWDHGNTCSHFSEVDFLYAQINTLKILTEEYHTNIIIEILDKKFDNATRLHQESEKISS